MTVKEAARYLGVSPTVVYGHIARRHIPHYRLGMGERGAIRLDVEDLDAFKASRRVDALTVALAARPVAPAKRSLPSVADLASLRRAGKL